MHWIYAHLIGDYIIQNDWMAQNKKSSSFHCAIHVLTYMLPFLFCGFNWWQLSIIAGQHYIVDRTNVVMWFMKAKGSEKFATGPCYPWSIIIVDNISHILTIALVAYLGGL
jgi:hypothetical protein